MVEFHMERDQGIERRPSGGGGVLACPVEVVPWWARGSMWKIGCVGGAGPGGRSTWSGRGVLCERLSRGSWCIRGASVPRETWLSQGGGVLAAGEGF